MNSLTSRTKPISQFLKPTSKTLYISLFSTSSSSSSSYPPPHHYPSPSSYRRQDEESRAVRVSVWWDIENCVVPNGINVFKIAHSITSAVRANGIKGPVHINAFGDIFCLNRANQEALSSTGVNLIHIPNGGKNSADRSLLVDLMYWVTQNPPPAHIFLISGDRDFAGILHKLRMSNYNILLAAREGNSSGVLYSSASIMWHWNDLVKGENLSGKHFNQPPDGPFNSWYGHYRGPLEDPFAISAQQKYSETEDLSNPELSSDTKLRPVPMAVLRQLRRIVNSHPEGFNITDLRDQLRKGKVLIDKDFYGHKKFSRFLMALPRIVKVETRPDGQFFLQPVITTSSKLVESNAVSGKAMTVNGNRDAQVISKANNVSGKARSVNGSRDVQVSSRANDVSEKTGTVNGNTDVQVISRANAEAHRITRMVDLDEKSNETPEKELAERENTVTVEEKLAEDTLEKKVLDACLSENDVVSIKDSIGKEPSNVELVENSMIPTKEHNSEHGNGFFRKIWTKLFRGSIDAEKIGNYGPGRISSTSVIPEKSISEEMPSESSKQNEVHDREHTSSDISLNLMAKADTTEKSEDSQGFIAKIVNWCKFWKNETSTDKLNEIPNEEPRAVEDDSRKVDQDSKKLDNDASEPRKPELFTKDSFWSALRSFFKTNRGSDIVVNSLSREQIAERLQKEGPLFLQPLSANDINHLVELLVTEKKWIKEFPANHPRFKLISLYDETSAHSPSQPHNPTGLSSIFLNSAPHDNPQVRVSSIAPKKHSEKPRTQILSDCQKLLDEVLSQNPDGSSISLFKKQFLEKYGYALDHQKLGYPKLVNLLQMMPGVKVESTRLFPDSVVYAPGIQSLGVKEKSTGSDSEMSDSSRKEDDVGSSPWDELGPVEKSNLSKTAGEYELTVSDDDELSDVEKEEGLTLRFPVKLEDKKMSREDEEDSSLLQILDTWYITKGEDDRRENGSDPESSLGSSEDETIQTGKYVADIKGEEVSTVDNGWKQMSQKRYTFVSDGPEPKKGHLIDGILGSIKKNGEARV